MKKQLLHIFSNLPFGRHMLMQSVYFCSKTQTSLAVHIPKYDQLLMYFEHKAVTVYLNKDFLKSPETAEKHVNEIVRQGGLEPNFVEPVSYTASLLPDIPVDFEYMSCPRSISDLSAKINLGHMEATVRNIVRNALFHVLIPTTAYTEWKSMTVFFDGSQHSVRTMKIGIDISKRSGFPLLVFTHAEKSPRSHYKEILEKNELFEGIRKGKVEWLFFEKGKFFENLYEVPFHSLIIAGAYGHGLIKELLFGSRMEEIHTILPNNILIVGPYATV
jgi:hypothetical protein